MTRRVPIPMYMARTYPALKRVSRAGLTSSVGSALSRAILAAPVSRPVDDLALRRVRQHVLEVDPRGVDPGPAVDHVRLAVAGPERVVAGAAVEHVAGRVVRAVDVARGPSPTACRRPPRPSSRRCRARHRSCRCRCRRAGGRCRGRRPSGRRRPRPTPCRRRSRPHSRSLPEPPNSRSAPWPPQIRSSPSPPNTVSGPAPAPTRSSPASASITSAAARPANPVISRRPGDLRLRLRRACQPDGQSHRDRHHNASCHYPRHCPTSGLKSVDASVKPSDVAKLRRRGARGSGSGVGRYSSRRRPRGA